MYSPVPCYGIIKILKKALLSKLWRSVGWQSAAVQKNLVFYIVTKNGNITGVIERRSPNLNISPVLKYRNLNKLSKKKVDEIMHCTYKILQ